MLSSGSPTVSSQNDQKETVLFSVAQFVELSAGLLFATERLELPRTFDHIWQTWFRHFYSHRLSSQIGLEGLWSLHSRQQSALCLFLFGSSDKPFKHTHSSKMEE